MKEYEADLIKLLAALTAAPRWMTALIIADGATFIWADTDFWRILSAVLSVLFAGVETYAAASMMRAWRQARPGTSPERNLFWLWLVTLLVLVVVMMPPIYANTTRIAFQNLPGWVLLIWSICVAASTFLVVGGVGYAEKARAGRGPTVPVVRRRIPHARWACETCDLDEQRAAWPPTLAADSIRAYTVQIPISFYQLSVAKESELLYTGGASDDRKQKRRRGRGFMLGAAGGRAMKERKETESCK